MASEWFKDGPKPPIEFSRLRRWRVRHCNLPQCITLPGLWAVLEFLSVEDAIRALGARKQIPDDRQDGIGILIPNDSEAGVLGQWARALQLEAVIWTALPPRFEDVEGLVLCLDLVHSYLKSLRGEMLEHAKYYIENVPEQIDTPYHRELKKLGGLTHGEG